MEDNWLWKISQMTGDVVAVVAGEDVDDGVLNSPPTSGHQPKYQ